MFYGWLTWLAPYYEGQGWRPERAGLLLAVWSVAQIPAALLAPAMAERRRRWRFWAGLTLACGFAGTLGALLLPQPPVVGPWLWAALMGIGVGAGFPLGLTVIAWRTPDGSTSAATSGLALGVGYTVAGLGPLLMGLLIDATGLSGRDRGAARRRGGAGGRDLADRRPARRRGPRRDETGGLSEPAPQRIWPRLVPPFSSRAERRSA